MKIRNTTNKKAEMCYIPKRNIGVGNVCKKTQMAREITEPNIEGR